MAEVDEMEVVREVQVSYIIRRRGVEPQLNLTGILRRLPSTVLESLQPDFRGFGGWWRGSCKCKYWQPFLRADPAATTLSSPSYAPHPTDGVAPPARYTGCAAKSEEAAGDTMGADESGRSQVGHGSAGERSRIRLIWG